MEGPSKLPHQLQLLCCKVVSGSQLESAHACFYQPGFDWIAKVPHRD